MMKPISWSELSTWLEDKKKWERKYILGLSDPVNYSMKRGTDLHKFLFDPSVQLEGYTSGEDRVHKLLLKNLSHVLCKSEAEKKVETKIFGIPTIGFWDGYKEKSHQIIELKTGRNIWREDKIQSHRQLDFYFTQAEYAGIEVESGILVSCSTTNGKFIAKEKQNLIEYRNSIKSDLFSMANWIEERGLTNLRISSKDSLKYADIS